MATCKDCLHVDVCCSYLSTAYNKCKLAIPDFKLLKNIECDECEHFKDRSRFVELPCKVGDTVYRLKDGKVTKEQVVEFGISSRGVVLYRTLGYELGYSDYFGNSLFFSKEEAEQALKEREQRNNTN